MAGAPTAAAAVVQALLQATVAQAVASIPVAVTTNMHAACHPAAAVT
jgi:hypothetical protein